jgi:hypothetical protein
MQRFRLLAIWSVCLSLFAFSLGPVTPTYGDSCQFVLGFAALQSLIPQVVGNCIDNEQHGANGDGLQHTTGVKNAVGLMVWRKADNWTAYTDGYHTWVNGPNGLQERLNIYRFCWEGDAASYPLVPGSPSFGSPGCPAGRGLPLLVMLLSPDAASYFNQVAGDNDIGGISANRLDLANSVTRGQKMVFFASWAQAQSQIPTLASEGFKIIAYDPEHWAQTPQSEQQNLVATVAAFSQAVHSAGLQFLVVPDRGYTQQYAAQLAPYADYYILQGQRLEADPASYASWINQEATAIHEANANTKVYAQVVTGLTDPTTLLAIMKADAGVVNGIAIWASPAFLSDLQSVVGQYKAGS